MSRKRLKTPTNRTTDLFMDVHRSNIPPFVRWLHRQATFGYANKTSKSEAAFAIMPNDVAVMPDLQDISVVVLGYVRTK